METKYDIPDLPDQTVPDPSTFDGIVVNGVSKAFGDKKVLTETNLLVKKGETLVIIGRSGEGKSVLLKHIVRLLEPDCGQIWVEGQEISKLEMNDLMELRKKFGFLFQGAALFDSMNIGQNVGLMLQEHTDWTQKRIDDRACECLAMVGLEGAADKLPSELSGGMKKRAGLARAIVMEPEYILYDEPTTGLDPITGDAINDLIIKLQEELGVTSVAVTHDMPSAFKIAHRMAMLSRGNIVYSGTVEEIHQTDHPMVRQFIKGSSHGPLGAF
ncbi:MAG: phospholipid/cholesterol/gamma-HCH transport system ATP-binding protein [Candidatus Krumholzibacteriia bacterium]|jgi:phospholipid/cholesterol/gamma-HCH transport system ATP-binding protein